MNRFKKATIVSAIACVSVFAQTPQWQNLYPSYSGLAFGDGKFVAVALDGVVKTGDGNGSWTQFAPANIKAFHSAAFGSGMFAVYGMATDGSLPAGGRVFISTDAQNWGMPNFVQNKICNYLTFGGNNFVGIRDNDSSIFVYDIEDNYGSYFNQSHASSLLHIAFGANRLVAVGTGIIYANAVNVMGSSWQVATGASGSVSAVAYGDGKFVALGASGNTVYTSVDGVSWTSTPSSSAPAAGRIVDMAFGDGKFVAVGASIAAVSSNGVQWTTKALNSGDSLKAVKYGNNKFVALGSYGSVYTSSDGAVWDTQAEGRRISYKSIAYGQDMFVAVGDAGVSVSTDGKNWVRKEMDGHDLQAVAYGAGRFVAVGDDGAIFSSADGSSWASHERSGRMFLSVAFGNDKFLAVGKMQTGDSPVICESADGQNWDDVNTSAVYWGEQRFYPTAVSFGNNTFVVGVSDGTLKSSQTGARWTEVAAKGVTSSNTINSITYSEGKFVALGRASAITSPVIVSDDGANFATTAQMPVAYNARAAVFAKGHYIVVADSGHIYTSQNGSAWGKMERATNRNLNTVYFGNNILFAAGASGALLYSSETPMSTRYAISASRSVSPKTFGMKIENTRSAPVVTLSFTPESRGTLAIFSLTGKQLYKTRLELGQRSAVLPKHIANGSVIARYVDGSGKTISRMFQTAR